MDVAELIGPIVGRLGEAVVPQVTALGVAALVARFVLRGLVRLLLVALLFVAAGAVYLTALL